MFWQIFILFCALSAFAETAENKGKNNNNTYTTAGFPSPPHNSEIQLIPTAPYSNSSLFRQSGINNILRNPRNNWVLEFGIIACRNNGQSEKRPVFQIHHSRLLCYTCWIEYPNLTMRLHQHWMQWQWKD